MADSTPAGPQPAPPPQPQGEPATQVRVPQAEPATEVRVNPAVPPSQDAATEVRAEPVTELIQEPKTELLEEAIEDAITERLPELYPQPPSTPSLPEPAQPAPAPHVAYPPPGYAPTQGYAPPQPAPGYGYVPPPQAPGYNPQPVQGYGYVPQPPVQGYAPPDYGYVPQPQHTPQPGYGFDPQGQPAPLPHEPAPLAAEPPVEDHPRQPGSTAFWGTIAWRLVLTVLAAYPLFLMFVPPSTPWTMLNQLLFFTTLTNIVIFLANAYGVLRPLLLFWAAPHLRTEGRTAWLRGLATTMGVFTAVVFAVLLGGDYSGPSLITHLILPAAMVIDWLFVGRAQGNNGFSTVITWVLLLIPYVGIYYWDATTDRPMYEFLNPKRGDFWYWIGVMTVSYAALAVGVVLIGRISAWIRRTATG